MTIHQTFTPAQGFLLIEILESSESPVDIAQDEAKAPSVKGAVVAIGPNKLHESGEHLPSNVAVKDVVIFKTYGIDDVKVNDIDYKIVPVENIRGVLKNEN